MGQVQLHGAAARPRFGSKTFRATKLLSNAPEVARSNLACSAQRIRPNLSESDQKSRPVDNHAAGSSIYPEIPVKTGTKGGSQDRLSREGATGGCFESGTPQGSKPSHLRFGFKMSLQFGGMATTLFFSANSIKVMVAKAITLARLVFNFLAVDSMRAKPSGILTGIGFVIDFIPIYYAISPKMSFT
jgi:hypothetical protein